RKNGIYGHQFQWGDGHNPEQCLNHNWKDALVPGLWNIRSRIGTRMAGLIASVTTNAFGNALILPNEHEIIKRARKPQRLGIETQSDAVLAIHPKVPIKPVLQILCGVPMGSCSHGFTEQSSEHGHKLLGGIPVALHFARSDRRPYLRAVLIYDCILGVPPS